MAERAEDEAFDRRFFAHALRWAAENLGWTSEEVCLNAGLTPGEARRLVMANGSSIAYGPVADPLVGGENVAEGP